jgi:hypothetical protein
MFSKKQKDEFSTTRHSTVVDAPVRRTAIPKKVIKQPTANITFKATKRCEVV